MKSILSFLILACLSGMAVAQGTDRITSPPVLSTVNNQPITGSNITATSDPGETGNLRYAYGHSVWFRVQLSAPATFNAKTEGSNFDTTLAVYRGARISEMRELASSDDAPGGLWSEVLVDLQPGTYYVAVDGFGGATGNYTLAYQFANGNSAAAAPANDNFANPELLATGNGGGVTRASVLYATVQPGESATSSSSVWYRYDASHDGSVVFRTLDSGFDTHLTAYTGNALNALTEVARNDDVASGTDLGSEIVVQVSSGTSYYIRLAAVGDGQGTTYLSHGEAGMSGLAKLDASYSGAFWNPTRSGEGVLLEIADHPNPMTLGEVLSFSWYTYDPNGNPVYLTGAAVIDPTAATFAPITINVITTRGARFGSAFATGDVIREDWGQVVLTFTGCSRLTVAYTPTRPGWGASGSINMQRVIARAPGNHCP